MATEKSHGRVPAPGDRTVPGPAWRAREKPAGMAPAYVVSPVNVLLRCPLRLPRTARNPRRRGVSANVLLRCPLRPGTRRRRRGAGRVSANVLLRCPLRQPFPGPPPPGPVVSANVLLRCPLRRACAPASSRSGTVSANVLLRCPLRPLLPRLARRPQPVSANVLLRCPLRRGDGIRTLRMRRFQPTSSFGARCDGSPPMSRPAREFHSPNREPSSRVPIVSSAPYCGPR